MTRKRVQATVRFTGVAALAALVITGCSREAPPAAADKPPPAASAPADTTPRVDFATFHASGELPCRIAAGEPIGSCAFGVRREGGGNAIVTIMPPGAATRTIHFANGLPAGPAPGQDDADSFEGHREGRLFVVTIGPERYEIPDIVVFGD